MLTNKEKKYLRTVAQQKDIIKFNIGKDQIDQKVIEMIEKGILKHEMVKISFLKSALGEASKEQYVLDLLSTLNADLVQSIGNTIIIYRPNTKLAEKSLVRELRKL